MAFDENLFWHRTEEANRVIRNAARRLSRNAKKNITAMDADDTGAMRRHVGQKSRKRHGEIDRISLKTYRYGIIREHGAGRGWPGGKRVSGSGEGKPRTPAPWISKAFDDVVPSLADDLARVKGDDFVEEVDEQFRGIFRDRYRI